MTVIGITGPSGAGKTTVLSVLEELGAAVIDCDAVYHRLLRENGPLLAEIRSRFGDAVFDPAGKLDRKQLGNIVFRDAQALASLNTITHRYIAAQVERALAAARREGRPAAAVDAIALIESGLAGRCDVTAAVTAPADLRVKRLMAREGVSEEYARARVAAQKPDRFYEEHCDLILHNSGAPEACRKAAAALYAQAMRITAPAAGGKAEGAAPAEGQEG